MKTLYNPQFFIRISVILFLFFAIQPMASGQLFKKIKDKTMKKVEDKIEDRIVEEVSNELTRRAMKPINQAFDDFLEQSMKDQYGDDYDSSKRDSLLQVMGTNYEAFLEGMNKAANLPPSYTFDYQMYIETEDYQKSNGEMEMMFSKDKPFFGMVQYEGNTKNIIILDLESDVMVLYNEDENGNKTAQALPSMLKLAMVMNKKETDMNHLQLKIEGPGKSKKIAGYESFQYKAEDDQFKYEYYLSQEVPFTWQDTFGETMKQFAPNAYNPATSSFKGMMLEGNTEHKTEKKKYKWKTKKIENESIVLNNSDYKFAQANHTEK